jgi:hypothetical protein
MKPSGERKHALIALAAASVALAAVGVLFASANPDGLEKFAEEVGIASRARALLATPLADYEASWLAGEWMRKAAAGLGGLAMIFGLCVLVGRVIARRRSA